MPVRTYMVVDPRHDHGFRVPRPDVSARLGTPNACNDCHADKAPEWAASAIERWHGPRRKGFQNYAEAFHAAWENQADAATLLAAVAADRNTPGIARASALSELGPRVSRANIGLARPALSDPDPMVRIGALDMLESVPAALLWPLASPLLSDSNHGVRIRAAALLAAVPAQNQPAADRERFERAAAEFVAAQRLNADRPEARSALGNFLARRGQPAEAETEHKAALLLSAQYVPAAVNLADLYRQQGRESDGESVLRTAIATSPRDAGLHFALGLTLVRLKRADEALVELRHAAELEPDRARYAYVHAVALHTGGHVAGAIAALKANLARHPRDRETLMALVGFHRDAGEVDAALAYAEELALIAPEDQELARLILQLRRQGQNPAAQ
jgi:Flp pilus assembly protein TadD